MSPRALRAGALLAAGFVLALAVAVVRMTAAETYLRVYLVDATEAAGTIDPRLNHIVGLRAPPFDRFRAITVLSLDEASMAVGAQLELILPDGRRTRVAVAAMTDSGVRVVACTATSDGREENCTRPIPVLPGGHVILAFGDGSGRAFIVVEHALARIASGLGTALSRRPRCEEFSRRPRCEELPSLDEPDVAA